MAADCRVHVLQISPDMYQSDNLQKARRPTTSCVPWSVALLHILQVVQLRSDLQYAYAQHPELHFAA